MSFENMDSKQALPLIGDQPRLADMKPVVWFLGFGVGGATGLALAWAPYVIGTGKPTWIAIAAALIAMIHASIITVFWLNKETVRRRTAVMVSMSVSAVLTGSLAWISGSNGMQTGPLYGLAVMHLIMAFFHPMNVHIEKSRD
jgi:putative flippase GtrA